MASTLDPSPELFALIKFLAGGGATNGTSTTPSQPSAELQAFLDAIPFANDGDVITADHHNTLRKAIGRIAGSLDESQFVQVQTLSFSPALLPVADGPGDWRSMPGIAVGPKTGGNAEGWMPLDLPNGTNVDSLTVRGKLPKPATIWSVSLRRRELAGTLEADVCTDELQDVQKDAGGAFAKTIPATTEQLTPAQAAEQRRIDNSKYRYFFHTALGGAQQGDAVELDLVQLTCTRG